MTLNRAALLGLFALTFADEVKGVMAKVLFR